MLGDVADGIITFGLNLPGLIPYRASATACLEEYTNRLGVHGCEGTEEAEDGEHTVPTESPI